MFYTKLLRPALIFRSIQFRLNNNRLYCTPGPNPTDPIATGVKPTNMQKKFLVWTGRFKTEADIPVTVTQSTINQAESKMRIRTANILMILTLVGCVFAVISGKKKAARGETVQQMNIDWHKEYNSKFADKKE